MCMGIYAHARRSVTVDDVFYVYENGMLDGIWNDGRYVLAKGGMIAGGRLTTKGC